MKIKPEHYEELKVKVFAVIDTFPNAAAYRKKFENNQTINPDMTRRWDIMSAAKIGKLINQLYSYMNHNNIDTALKTIIAEYDNGK